MSFNFYDLIGSVGAGIIILTYLLLQIGKLQSDRLDYSILNAVGAAMITFSLIFDFNFSAFMIEIFWLLISVYGIFRYFLRAKT